MIHIQTPNKNPVSARHHLLRLLGVNLSLAVLLCLQAGSVRTSPTTNTAWLIQRTPAMTEELHAAAEASSSAVPMITVALDDNILSIVPYLQESSLPSGNSMSELRLATPVVEEISSASSESPESSTSVASSDVSASASSASIPLNPIPGAFPAFDHAVSPVHRTPNWGAMKTPAEWNRSYKQMGEKDFVQIPAYDMRTLMTPLEVLAKTRDEPETVRMITAKLYYSTRYFGAYDLDSGEFSAVHPGIDLKLAEGTPIGSVAGGRVHDVRHEEKSLGLHVIVEHRTKDGQTFYSIYGHLDQAWVAKGDDVIPGTAIGTVGMTGNTSGPHLHLQIDLGEPDEPYHTVYWPNAVPGSSEAAEHSINPVTFIRTYASE